ncbi:MAG: class I SAM-dependent methyltransferase [Opitutales bacterium]|nr:class I SAM-dependent methyltransferase [Opitutales bacterium]
MSDPSPRVLLEYGGWPAHRLIDCGHGRKLEQFGALRLIRGEPKAWWRPRLDAGEWAAAHAEFGDDGRWKRLRADTPERWTLTCEGLTLEARLSHGSKHVGVFPEQEPHWRWVRGRLAARGGGAPASVLNLFGYTGVATLAAAGAGAQVTHVDASKPALAWARENQRLSGMGEAPVRWLLDDAFKFVAREIRRGRRYDLILLDPPSFGRGPRGEVWKVENQIADLMDLLRQLVHPDSGALVLTLYNLEASPLMLHNLVRDAFPHGALEVGELVLGGEGTPRLPLSLFARWAGPAA